MTSQYTRLQAPSATRLQSPITVPQDDDFELESVPHQDSEQHELLTQAHTLPVSPSSTESSNYTPYHDDVPAPSSPVLSIPCAASKKVVASVTPLTSQPTHVLEKRKSNHSTSAFPKSLMSWVLEVIAIVVSIGSLLAIVAILRREDGQLLSSWTLKVSLNTVIAALGTLSRTTLAFALSACLGQQKWNWLTKRTDCLAVWARFDEASRGPWGASRLFIWLRARHWAALGALVVIGTVAFDPFLQAVLSTEGQLNIVPDLPAHISQALIVDAGRVVETTAGALYSFSTSAGPLSIGGVMTVEPDFGLISAVYNGFQNDTSWYRGEQVVNNICATGNCTWSAFPSAAVCSMCNDLTDKVLVQKGFGTDGWNIPVPSTTVFKRNYTTFSLRNVNISNSDSATYTKSLEGRTAVERAIFLAANTTFNSQDTTSFQDLQTMLISFVVLKASKEWVQGGITWNRSTPTAAECAFYLCTNMYKATTQDGKLTETLLRSWAIRDSQSYKAKLESSNFGPEDAVNAFVASRGDILYDGQIERTDLQLLLPAEEYPEITPRTFNVSYGFITTISDFFAGFAVGTDSINQMVYPAVSEQMTPLAKVLWDSENPTDTFEHVARSLTNHIRSKANSNASYVKDVEGATQKWAIHVRVKWPFLVFPIAMISFGIVYVILTIIESTRLRVPVWKESALPSLLHGLSDETQSLIQDEPAQPEGKRPGDVLVRFEIDKRMIVCG